MRCNETYNSPIIEEKTIQISNNYFVCQLECLWFPISKQKNTPTA